MFTRFRLPVFQPTGDWRVDAPRLNKWLQDYFLSLEKPGALSISFDGDDWTPTIVGQTTPGTQTYTEQYGRYMVVGNWVLIEGRVELSAKGGTMAGNVNIGGLPVTSASSGVNAGAVSLSRYNNVDISAGYAQLGLQSVPASKTLLLVESGDNVAGQVVGAAAVSNTTALHFGGWYRTA